MGYRTASGTSAFLLALLCLFLSSATRGSTKSSSGRRGRTKVCIAVGSQRTGNIVYLQLELAKALRYFEEENLDVTFLEYPGGNQVAQALESGKADFSGNSIDHAISMRRQARPLQMVASFTNLPAVTLVVRRTLRSQVRSVTDLRGHRIGISSTGSGTHVIAAAILHSAGVPQNTVTFVGYPSRSDLYAALKNGTIDAAIATDPAAIQMLVDGGGSLLLDLVTYEETQRVFHGGYQFTGLMTRTDMIANHPDIVQKVVNAISRANRFIASHSATDIAGALPAAMEQDRFVFVRSIEHTRPSLSADGLVTVEGVANNIESQKILGLLRPEEKVVPGDYFDMRFMHAALRQVSMPPARTCGQ